MPNADLNAMDVFLEKLRQNTYNEKIQTQLHNENNLNESSLKNVSNVKEYPLNVPNILTKKDKSFGGIFGNQVWQSIKIGLKIGGVISGVFALLACFIPPLAPILVPLSIISPLIAAFLGGIGGFIMTLKPPLKTTKKAQFASSEVYIHHCTDPTLADMISMTQIPVPKTQQSAEEDQEYSSMDHWLYMTRPNPLTLYNHNPIPENHHSALAEDLKTPQI